jgi:hypothetical protein
VSNKKKKKKKKQNHIDPTFKKVMVERFAELDIPIKTEVEVTLATRTIDTFIRLEKETELAKVRQETPFSYFLGHNQAEFKGIENPLDIWDFYRIKGRGFYYLADNKVPPQDMTITIICAGEPRTVLHHSQELVQFKRIGSGYYESMVGYPRVYIIVINELPIIEKNYFLLVFTSSERQFKAFMTQSLQEGNYEYLNSAYKNRPQLTREILKMIGATTIPRENLEFIAKDIGSEQVSFLTAEQLVSLTPQQRLAGMTLEQLVGLIPQQFSNLAPEQRIIKPLTTNQEDYANLCSLFQLNIN